MGLFDKTPKYDIDLEKFETSEPNHAETFNKRMEKLIQSFGWMKENVLTKDQVIRSADIQEDNRLMDGKTLSEYLKSLVITWEEKLSEGLRGKVDKISGKGLSTNDFTDLLKEKLDQISETANNYIHPKHTKYSAGLYKVTVDEEGHIVSAAQVTKDDITELGIPGQDTNTTYDLVSTDKPGLAPKRTGTTTKYLRDDGTWAVPPDTDTTYGVVSTSGPGLVPKRTGTTTKYFCDDGTWKTPPDTNTTYDLVSMDKPGLVPKRTGTTIKYFCDDGTWKTPPDTDTTYGIGTGQKAGISKLYTETGKNTDGSMTQKAISEEFAKLNGKLSTEMFGQASFVNGWDDFEVSIYGLLSGNVVTLRIGIALLPGHAEMPANTEWSLVTLPEELIPMESLTFSAISESGIPVKLSVTPSESGKIKIRTANKPLPRVGIYETLTYIV